MFDLLRDAEGDELLDLPLAERRRRLEHLLAGAPPRLTLCPQTTDVALAREWLTTWTSAGIEGVVAKRLDVRYQPGSRRRLRSSLSTSRPTAVRKKRSNFSTPNTTLVSPFSSPAATTWVSASRTGTDAAPAATA
ncbi:MAG TPA: hypothetical protein VFT95_23830 [Micromonosporaceae bacterium]|nr:hypothetical protein [Micromonosporaceae bacterium]